ncbi:hypothetical protein EI94DRAFT_1722380 [Lactarius quietus]|nr:hypothetical protein EI94DRAFT_1722380 [Lactarius quietus]
MIKHVVLLTGTNPISFSEGRLRSRCAGYVQKKHNERGGCRHSVVNVGNRMGFKKTCRCLAKSANTVCVEYRAENSPHSFVPCAHSVFFFSLSFWLVCARRTHHSHTSYLVLIPCPGFCVSMRRQGGAIRMTTARGGRAAQIKAPYHRMDTGCPDTRTWTGPE